MTPLGKPLVFYLKYMAEMNRFYGDPEYYGGEPDLAGVDGADQVREMARTVGAAASEQVADFLELCGKGIEDHFVGMGIATLEKKAKRSRLVDYWEWSAKYHVSSVPGGWFYCGLLVSAPPDVHISLEKDVCGVVVPWLWSKGGRKGADAVWKILGGWPHSRSGVLVGDRSTVALACIQIKAQPPDNFDVDRDPLIAEVQTTFARVGAEQTKAIASFVAGLKKTDET
jgi:hypothetical protein